MDESSRRSFVTSALATGFALAVRPVHAEVIITDTDGLLAGDVKVPAAGGEIPAYRAMPREGKTHAVVLVVQEIFGVHEHIKDICRRFAQLGYCAVAPELYARQGDVSKIADIQEIIAKVVSKVPDAQVMSDLDATLQWAASSSKGDIERLAITGFCWGGRIAWLYAAHQPKLKAAAAWYGRLSSAQNAFQPKSPLDLAASLKAPVLGLYGGRDSGIPVAHVEMMRAEIARAQGASELVVYPDAPHAFFADYRPSYRRADAVDAFKRAVAWFTKYGVV